MLFLEDTFMQHSDSLIEAAFGSRDQLRMMLVGIVHEKRRVADDQVLSDIDQVLARGGCSWTELYDDPSKLTGHIANSLLAVAGIPLDHALPLHHVRLAELPLPQEWLQADGTPKDDCELCLRLDVMAALDNAPQPNPEVITA